MTGIVCSMVGASFAVAAAAEVIRLKKGIVALGNTQIDTAQSKFGGASALFDGTGDLLQADTTASLTIASSEDFTIEGWIRPGSVSGTPGLLTDRASSNSLSGVNWDISIFNGTYITSRTNTLLLETGSGAGSIVIISNNNVFTTNTWYHFAVVRSSNVITLYVNGTDVTNNRTGTQSSAIGAGNLTMGGFPNGALMYTGHMDEIRWSNSARYTSNFTPSTTAFVNDANTLLLLHCDGTDATTYFEDDNGVRMKAGLESTSTVVTSTTQSKFGGSSVYFPETSGQYLNAFYSPQAMGLTNNGDFTVELWAYFTKLPSSGDAGYMMFYSHSPEPYVLFQSGGVFLGAGGYPGFTGSNFAINTWYHVAISRASGSMRCFVNGTQYGSTVTGSTYNYIPFTNNLATRFGKFGDDRGRWQGYMEEIRFSKVARYTSNFTAPTAPFVNDADTILLIHGDGTNNNRVFEDDNGQTPPRTPKHISYYGNAQISTAQSKFGGSSALFDGNTDALVISPVSTFNFNSDFTIEMWIRMTQFGEQVFFDTREGSGGTNTGGYLVREADSVLRFYLNATVILAKSAPNITTNTWSHVAITRSGNNFNMWIDGTSVSSATSSATGSSINAYIGRNSFSATSGNTVGYIDEFRFSNTARYTANFTPSTTAFQNDENTLLLLHFDGADASTVFVDDAGQRTKKGITAINNAQIDTAQSKFGGSALLCDGTTDYLDTSTTSEFAFGTSQYTIECWLRLASTGKQHSFFDLRAGGNDWVLYVNSSNKLEIYTGAGATETNSMSANVWYHIAVVRDATNIKVYRDGTQVLSTSAVNITGDRRLRIGGGRDGASYPNTDLNGWMDEVRVSNIARYTANFTPATTPFQNDANTLLLLHMDGTDGSTVFTDDNGVTPDHDYGS